ncbi:MltG/YceG/YrrL family protein [Paramaledivibacter caminithermalis]|jgi:cell division protein YceG involved in septum cleavage|uniref:YceG-like family protein n=1 Tax=Paramaledivibacter caminithermalis (strain DSM 15212 / CIP 107654 / DViRD3) TaxID=1121301 RepID=A0A1M6MN84_PARC5|nr:hypothetical protein [Paramaledivibacter caminithermalis]SHJ84846.1 hypothetical protein SAMN02745912_01331 [Paramaledivibacter caminithermalis DSM 15212]
MFEKIKDFFYDFSDTLLSLFIILVMGFVITWKLSGAMSIPIFNTINNPSIKILEENPKNIEINISDGKTNDKSHGNNTETNSNVSQENSNQDTTNSSTNSNTENKAVHIKAENIDIQIPKGTSGIGIANILKEKGLIDDTSKFLNRVEELELAPKLRYGEFSIKSNSSIDEMITIITGVNINN